MPTDEARDTREGCKVVGGKIALGGALGLREGEGEALASIQTSEAIRGGKRESARGEESASAESERDILLHGRASERREREREREGREKRERSEEGSPARRGEALRGGYQEGKPSEENTLIKPSVARALARREAETRASVSERSENHVGAQKFL
jgi:hypothetical protein